ncbi:hypothetical protein [Nocardia sp. CNY236]|uniref:hypothetical protein n=1 Tax=Nocardia sp. CNY236 TaxID=1169152 RepID=UPI0003F9099F|nr:hypothetical protein [Nocardia sp. CNY236]
MPNPADRYATAPNVADRVESLASLTGTSVVVQATASEPGVHGASIPLTAMVAQHHRLRVVARRSGV